MLLFDGIGGLFMLALWIFCFIDVVVTPEGECRNLPKLAWVFIVLLVPGVGSIVWLVAGHPWNRAGVPDQRTKAGSRLSGYGQPNRSRPSNPDDDEVFLAGLRKRAEEQRRRGRDHPDNEQSDDRLGGDKS